MHRFLLYIIFLDFLQKKKNVEIQYKYLIFSDVFTLWLSFYFVINFTLSH